MSTITSIDQVRPSNGQNTAVNQNTAAGYAGNTSGSFRAALDQAVLDQVREDKISSSDHGQYDAIFEQASACYNLPVALLKAITKVESDFNPYDVSSAGAKGLMQLMPSTAAEVGVTDPFDPWQNIMGATKYIRKQLDRFGDLRTALAAYNTGPGNVKKYGGEPDYCKRYVDKVLAYMGEAQVDTSSVGAAYDVLANQGNGSYNLFGGLGNSYNMLGSSYGMFGNQGGSYSMFGSLGNLYGMSGGLGNTYGMAGGFGLLGSYYGTQGSSDGLLGSSGSGLGLLSNSSGYASLYALSGLLSAGSSSGDDTVTLSKEGFNSLIELMRIQMMMGAEQTVGTMSLL